MYHNSGTYTDYDRNPQKYGGCGSPPRRGGGNVYPTEGVPSVVSGELDRLGGDWGQTSHLEYLLWGVTENGPTTLVSSTYEGCASPYCK